MSSTVGSKPVYDVLIVGCGAIAGGYDRADASSKDVLTHAKAFTTHPGFRVVACVEPDDARRRAFQDRWGIAGGYADLAQVDVPFDVASLCTPTEHHAEGLEPLLNMAPKLVFAEKPVTDDLALTRELVAAYGVRGIPLCVNYLRRWAPGIVALRDEIARGEWGALRRGIAHYTKGLLNNGSHMVDVLNFLVGPVSAVARHGAVEDGRPYDPTEDALMTAAGGAPIHLMAANADDFTIFELDLLFAKGRVTLTDSMFTILRRWAEPSDRFAGYTMLGEAAIQPTGLERALMGAADNIYRHLAHGEPLASDGRSALAAQEICTKLASLPQTVF